MTLATVFKGTEGIVFAADSRVTLSYAAQGTNQLLSSHYDNAIKLLRVECQKHVAAVTHGLGALGSTEPRTAHSYLSEFEATISNNGRMGVEEFANALGTFFLDHHTKTQTPAMGGDMSFIVGGYDEGEPYGRIFVVHVPSAPKAVELYAGVFGIAWGGQTEITARIMNGVDSPSCATLKATLGLDDNQTKAAESAIGVVSALKIPYQFLPLQDGVDLVILLVRTTAELMKFVTDVRGVGGAIDVATITKSEGFQYVQRKAIKGERSAR